MEYDLRSELAKLHQQFLDEELKIHGYEYNELSFSPAAFLRWLSKDDSLTRK